MSPQNWNWSKLFTMYDTQKRPLGTPNFVTLIKMSLKRIFQLTGIKELETTASFTGEDGSII